VNKVLADPDILQQMRTLGFDPAPESPEQFADEIRADAKKYGELVRRTGATAD
jgi:tripartite-type tricarboxylate transporter receptor subunit TctC